MAINNNPYFSTKRYILSSKNHFLVATRFVAICRNVVFMGFRKYNFLAKGCRNRRNKSKLIPLKGCDFQAGLYFAILWYDHI